MAPCIYEYLLLVIGWKALLLTVAGQFSELSTKQGLPSHTGAFYSLPDFLWRLSPSLNVWLKYDLWHSSLQMLPDYRSYHNQVLCASCSGECAAKRHCPHPACLPHSGTKLVRLTEACSRKAISTVLTEHLNSIPPYCFLFPRRSVASNPWGGGDTQ